MASSPNAKPSSGGGGGGVAVEEVALVVPETDDPSLPVLTFRAWVLGLASCTVLIFLNTFYTYRTQPLVVSGVLVQILALPAGRLMAAVLPRGKKFPVPFGLGEVDLNPGPFNVKEHVVITVFANCGVWYGGGDAYSVGAITVMRAYYHQKFGFFCALLIVLSTQLLGYGWAGMLRKVLVEPAEMWWPSNLAQVSLFRALHEKEKVPSSGHKGMTRMRFFLIFMTASFLYYSLPGYLFTILTFFSWVCWAWPHSVTAQQIGSGYHGLGVGAFTLDWAGISAYHGSPLVTPWLTIANTAVGFILFAYIIVPLCYWKFNLFEARRFPIFSSGLFTHAGQKYDTTKILTPDFDLNEAAYNSYGKLYLSPLFALSIASGFARFSATVVHVMLYNGRDVWRRSLSMMRRRQAEDEEDHAEEEQDVHAKLMRSYRQVPHWWFLAILFGSIALALVISFVWSHVVQLPWWGMLFACGFAWFITLPIGVIQATTNQQPGFDLIAQFLIGYALPGKPIATFLFKIYGRISSTHALAFLSDLKLGHYMKIPPRCMFVAQLAGTVVSGVVNLAVAWWMLGHIENICDADVLPEGSPWTCPVYRTQFDHSVIWGLVGPRRLFGAGGMYQHLTWLYLIGAFLPLATWGLCKMFPSVRWLRLIHIPVILYGFAGMPPSTPSNICCWLLVGMIFNYFLFKYRKEWWRRYNYVLSAALDTGTAFMGVFLFAALQGRGVQVKWWGSEFDHCPLATCPTDPDVVVKGCPVVR